MSDYRAIIFDLDGTAIPNAENGAPSPRLIEAVSKYREKIHLIAATGRTLPEALTVIQALGLTDPCIIMGGATTINPSNGQALTRTTLPPESVQAVLDILKAWPNHVYVRSDNIVAQDPINKASIGQDARLNHNVDMICVDAITDAELPTLKAQLEHHPKILVTTAPSWSTDHFLMISHRDATKEHAITQVLNRLGVPKTAAIGVGDGENDIHLFAAVGLKVAMGNATPHLKTAADITCASVDEDGLAEIIERFAT